MHPGKLASAVVVLASLAPLAAAQGFRLPQAEFEVASEPEQTAIADFDGDGHADVAAWNSQTAKVTVRYGDGAGRLAGTTTVTAPGSPDGVAIGDASGDGRADIVLATSGPSLVTLFLGQAGGTFAPGIVVASGVTFFDVGLGDANGDGKLDLVAVGAAGPAILTWLGLGGGAFGAPIATPYPSGKSRLVAADFDGDGKLDVVLLRAAPVVDFHRGLGDGTFAAGVATTLLQAATSAAAADLDGQAGAELLVDGPPPTAVVTLHLLANGSFVTQASLAWSDPVRSLAAGDLDGDGACDVVASAFQIVVAWSGSGGGGFDAPVTTVVDTYVRGLALGRMTSDAALDLVHVHPGALEPPSAVPGYAVVMQGLGDGRFHAPPAQHPLLPPAAMAAADLDGDGDADLVHTTVSYDLASSSSLYTYRSNGDGTFAAPERQDIPAHAGRLALGDWNGDGAPDAATLHHYGADTDVHLYRNVAGSLVYAGEKQVSGPGVLRLGDVNGDGRADLLIGDAYGYRIALSLAGGGFGAETSLPTTSTLQFAAADVNPDGKLDLIGIHGTGAVISQFQAFLGKGDGTFVQPQPAIWFEGEFLDFAVGELTGDTKLDGVALVAGKLVRFAHGGGGFFAKLPDIPVPDVDAHALAAGDFDGDGIDDVAVLGRELLLFHGGGLGAWPAPEAFAVLDNGPFGTLAALDLDADGRCDLATGFGASSAPGTGQGLVQGWRSGSPATSVGYGAGKSGAAGVPTLETLAPPVLGQASGLRLGSGVPGAAPLLLVGLTQTALPFDAGTLLVAPLLVVALPPFPGNGVLDVQSILPSEPALAGTAAFFQAMFVDSTAGGPYHTAQTRGLSWTFGD